MLFARGLRDISSSGAFFFFLFFLFYAARNTCFEARHAFSKAIQLLYHESTCVENREWEGEGDAVGPMTRRAPQESD